MATRRFSHVVPPTRVLMAMAALVALLLGSVVVASRAGAADEPYTVSGGHLDWGVKASFRSYVTTIGAGSVSVDGGASVNGDGTFRTPATGGTVAVDGSTASVDTEGGIHFSAHGGALDIDLSDLRVEISGTTGTIVVDATSTAVGGSGPEVYDDTALATLDLTGLVPTYSAGTLTWVAVPATMHADGVGIFDSYPAGTAMDPVTLVTELQAPATTTSSTAPSTTTTEAPSTTTTTEAPSTTTTEGAVWEPRIVLSASTDLDPAGQAVTVTGTGFDPNANVGTRPPVPGIASGVYVTFGRYADVWQPSAGAPGTTRQTIDQKWALPQASKTSAEANFGPNPQYVVLEADGSFTTTLTLRTDDTRSGSYGVVTYSAGGAQANASQETFTAVSFAAPTTTTTAPETTTTTAPETTTTTAPETTTTTAPETTTTTAPTTTTTAAPGGGVGVTGGHLDWGVKASFRSYVTTIGAGTVTVDGGAGTNQDGTFRFPVSSGTAGADGEHIDAAFGGSVRFTAHGGELDLRISGLEVEVDGDSGVLLADVVSHEQGTTDDAVFTDVELASLDLSSVTPGSTGLTVTWAQIAATLTEAGAPAFGGFYTAGAALDPLTVVLDLDETTVPTTPPTTAVPDAGTVSGSTFAPGDEITVTGRGFLPGEQVEVWLFSDPQWVGTAVAGEDGAVTYSFTLPADLPTGEHHVELRGVSSGVVVTTPAFTVVSADAATAVTPGSGTLPYTGGDSFPVGLAGTVLVLGGAALAVAARRRHRRPMTSVPRA